MKRNFRILLGLLLLTLLSSCAINLNTNKDTTEKIKGAAVGLTNASDQVKKTLQTSEGTLKNINIALKSLTEQTLPEIYQAAHSLKDTLQNVKEVTNKIKHNPFRKRNSAAAPPGQENSE